MGCSPPDCAAPPSPAQVRALLRNSPGLLEKYEQSLLGEPQRSAAPTLSHLPQLSSPVSSFRALKSSPSNPTDPLLNPNPPNTPAPLPRELHRRQPPRQVVPLRAQLRPRSTREPGPKRGGRLRLRHALLLRLLRGAAHARDLRHVSAPERGPAGLLGPAAVHRPPLAKSSLSSFSKLPLWPLFSSQSLHWAPAAGCATGRSASSRAPRRPTG